MLSGIRKPRWFSGLLGVSALALGLAGGCAPTPPTSPARDAEIYRRAESERTSLFEREVERLRADIAAAEQELVAVESGLRGSNSRADAVSALAEARIQVDRARKRAPWRAARVKEAEKKLEEADRLVAAENFGSAIFFSSRAERIAKNILEEAKMAESMPGARTVSGRRVNLRDGPSTQHAVLAVLLLGMPVFPEREEGDWLLLRTADGSVGWVHRALIR